MLMVPAPPGAYLKAAGLMSAYLSVESLGIVFGMAENSIAAAPSRERARPRNHEKRIGAETRALSVF